MMTRVSAAFALVLGLSAPAVLTTTLSAQGWKATEVVRVTAVGDQTPFGSIADIAVGGSDDFYVLDRKSGTLHGFDRAGAPRWRADVPRRRNPLLSMLGDTAAAREMFEAMGGAEMFRGVADSMAKRAAARAGSGPPRRPARPAETSEDRDRRQSELAALSSAGGALDPAKSLEAAENSGAGTALLMLSTGELAIPDMLGRQTPVFDTTGALLRTDGFFAMMDMPSGFAALGPYIVGATQSLGGMMAGMMSGGGAAAGYSVKVMPTEGSRSKELMHLTMPSHMSFDGTTMRMNLNPPRLLLASSGERLFVASNEHYSIAMYDTAGAKVGTLQRTVRRKPVTAADRMRTAREFGQMMDSLPPAARQLLKIEPLNSDSLPVIQELVAGDSLLLVRRASFESQDPPAAARHARWDIIDWDNDYRGYLDLPAGFRPRAIRNGRLYGNEGAAGKTEAVVVYTLAPPSSRTR